MSQVVTMDGQRVVEEHIIDGQATTMTRDATLAEQVDAMQKDILAQVVGMVSYASSGDVAVQGEDGDATMILRLRGLSRRPAPVGEPAKAVKVEEQPKPEPVEKPTLKERVNEAAESVKAKATKQPEKPEQPKTSTDGGKADVKAAPRKARPPSKR